MSPPSSPRTVSVSQSSSRASRTTFGGSDAAFGRVGPILEKLSADATHTGPSGTGAVMKVVTNLFVNASTALLAEVIITGERAGLSHEVMAHCLPKGSVKGKMLDMSIGPLTERDFTPRGAVEIFVKDMGIALEDAGRMGLKLEGLELARDFYERVKEAGFADKGTQVLLRVLRTMNEVG